MSSKKTLKRVEKELQKFADKESFGITVELLKEGEWSFDHNTNIITGCPSDTHADHIFLEVCKELGLEWDCPLFILSFLHEVGHAMTLDDLKAFEYNLPAIWVELKSIMVDEITDKDYKIYMKSKRERVATEWAVDFVNSNKESVLNLMANIVL